MEKLALIAILVFLAAGLATAQGQNQSSVSPTFVPGDIFYPVEQFVETIEAKVAGAIGGPDLAAKAKANNAEERLAEARKLAEKNKTEKIPGLMRKYEKQMNRALKISNRSKEPQLNRKLEEVRERNKPALEEVRKKASGNKGPQTGIGNDRGKSENRKDIPEAGKTREGVTPDEGNLNNQTGQDNYKSQKPNNSDDNLEKQGGGETTKQEEKPNK